MKNINTWSFNNDDLFELARVGRKTATCWLYDGTMSERVGDIEQIINSHGEKITIKITDLSVRRFADIDAIWAQKEGERDLTLAYWQQTHRDFFDSACNVKVTDDTKLVCMEFILA